MKINVVTTDTFEKEYKKLKKKYKSLREDLASFENELNANNNLGTDLGNGIRKVRLAIKSKNKGKSGGARIITYTIIIDYSNKEIVLVTIYDKGETESINDSEIKQILKRNNF